MAVSTIILALAISLSAASGCSFHPFPNVSCPLEDSIVSTEFVPFTSTLLDPFLNFSEGSIGNIHLTGGSTYNRTYTLTAPPSIWFKADFQFSVESLDATFTYQAKGNIDGSPFDYDVLPTGVFFGEGNGSISVRNLLVKGSYTLRFSYFTPVEFRRFRFERINFDLIDIHLGNTFLVNEANVDWDRYSASLKENFDRDFSSRKAAIEEKVRLHLNAQKCSFEQYTDFMEQQVQPCGDNYMTDEPMIN